DGQAVEPPAQGDREVLERRGRGIHAANEGRHPQRQRPPDRLLDPPPQPSHRPPPLLRPPTNRHGLKNEPCPALLSRACGIFPWRMTRVGWRGRFAQRKPPSR